MAKIHLASRTGDVLAEIGARLRRLRLSLNLRVEDLAARSGVSQRSITRLEAGKGLNLEFLVRVLRGLGRLQAIDSFIAEPPVSPIQIAKLGGKERQRASAPTDG